MQFKKKFGLFMTLFSFALIKDKRVGIVLFKKATRAIRSFKKKAKEQFALFLSKKEHEKQRANSQPWEKGYP